MRILFEGICSKCNSTITFSCLMPNESINSLCCTVCGRQMRLDEAERILQISRSAYNHSLSLVSFKCQNISLLPSKEDEHCARFEQQELTHL